jgi:hypothetical protein
MWGFVTRNVLRGGVVSTTLNPQTWRPSGLYLVCLPSFDLSGLGDPARSLRYRQHSSRVHQSSQASPTAAWCSNIYIYMNFLFSSVKNSLTQSGTRQAVNSLHSKSLTFEVLCWFHSDIRELSSQSSIARSPVNCNSDEKNLICTSWCVWCSKISIDEGPSVVVSPAFRKSCCGASPRYITQF